MSGTDVRADALYGLPLERFVSERNALGKALRAEGDRDGADAVGRLVKPTRAAWAVNVAVREHPEKARTLADAARLLSDVQRELLAGGHPSALRGAGERARAAVEALVAVAPASGSATIDKVRETFHAATVTPGVLAEVAAGRLTSDRIASGFGGLLAGADVSAGGRTASHRATAGKTIPRPAPGGRSGSPKDGGGARRRATAAGAQAQTRVRQSERRRAAQEAERAAREQARRSEQLRHAKEEEAAAERELTAARRALEQVESALGERRAEIRAAEARLRDVQRRRRRAER